MSLTLLLEGLVYSVLQYLANLFGPWAEEVVLIGTKDRGVRC